jgi:3-oxoacyl-[acyl-carrier-protein] synthase III
MEKIRHAKLSVEFGGALGRNLLSNKEYYDLVKKNYPESEIKDPEALQLKTGVTNRTWSDAGLKRLESGLYVPDDQGIEVNNLSMSAVKQLKERLPEGLGNIDMIIVACSNCKEDGSRIEHADHLRESLGLSSTVKTKTVRSACSGFVEALIKAREAIKAGANTVLVVGVDEMSRILDHSGKSGWLIGNLFGDGGGACLVTSSDTPGIIKVKTVEPNLPYSDLTVPGLRYFDDKGKLQTDTSKFATMRGPSVAKFVLREVSEVFLDLVQGEANWDRELDAFISNSGNNLCIPHQANARLIEEGLVSAIAEKAIARGSKLSREFLVERIREMTITAGFKKVGNLSAGSIAHLISILRDLPQYSSSWAESRIVTLIGFGAGPKISGITAIL